MDIATFERRGQDRWARTAALLRRVAESGLSVLAFEEVEELVTLHRQVVADFAFSRTHFGPVGTTERLRALAFEGHRALTPPEGAWLRHLLEFYRTTYPQLFRATLPYLAVALTWFLGFTLLGFVLACVTPQFASIWIGQSGIDNPDATKPGKNAVEGFSNRVAAEMLVPRDEFLAEWRGSDAQANIEKLVRKFWVSAFVVLRRARDLG